MDEIDSFFGACYEDRLEEVAARLDEDATLIHARRIGGRTPLHQAAFGGGLRVAALLIHRGADVNATSDYGWVPLHYAAAPASVSVAELLVRSGAAINVANGDGSTPLHFAVDFGKLPMVELLLLRGAAVNTRDQEGRTPLDYAAADSDLARLLRSKGAVPGVTIVAEVRRADFPKWLQGHEGAIGQLLDAVENQWNLPKRGQMDKSEDCK